MNTFEEYLKQFYTESVVKERLSFLRTIRKLLFDFGLDLDNCINDKNLASHAFQILKDNLSKRNNEKYLNVFRLYYNFITNDWFDNEFRPNPKSVITNKAKNSRWDPLPLPRQGNDNNAFPIYYDNNIKDEEKVPGLCSFLSDKYNDIIHKLYEIYNETGYGLLDDFKIKYDIRELYKIRVIIKKETPKNEYEISDEEKARKIKLLFNNNSNTSESDILKILQVQKETSRVTGSFFANYTNEMFWHPIESPHIEIYYRNIDADNIEEFYEKASMTLAHEYLHYIHCLVVGAKFFSKKNFEAKAVKEALADFFSMWFMLEENPDNTVGIRKQLAKERYDSWESNKYKDWPYAYALKLFELNNIREKFSYNQQDYYNCISTHISVFDKFLSILLESNLAIA